MDTVHIWLVAQGASPGTLWIAVRNYERWLPSWKQRFQAEYGKPWLLNPNYRGTQVIEVPKYAAMRANWYYVIGEKGLRQNPPESMLDGLIRMLPVCDLGELAFYDATNSEADSSPAASSAAASSAAGRSISIIELSEN